MSEIKTETKFGEVIIRDCILESNVNRTNLDEGIEIKLDDSYLAEMFNRSTSDFLNDDDEPNIEKIEKLIESLL